MGETWATLLITLSVPGLAIILGLGWFALVEGIAKTRRKD